MACKLYYQYGNITYYLGHLPEQEESRMVLGCNQSITGRQTRHRPDTGLRGNRKGEAKVMSKMIEEIAEDIVNGMNMEELKKAAKIGVMLSLRTFTNILKQARKENKDGKEEQHPEHPVL